MSKWMKKTVAACLTAAMAISCAGCGKTESNNSQQQEDNKNYVYKEEDFALEGIEGDIQQVITNGDKLYVCTYEWNEIGTAEGAVVNDAQGEDDQEADTQEDTTVDTTQADTQEEATEAEDTADEEAADNEDDEEEIEYETITRIYAANLDGTGVEEIPVEIEKDYYIFDMAVDGEGNCCLLLSYWDEKTETQSYYIQKVDNAGNTLFTNEVGSLLNLISDAYVSGLEVDEADNIYLATDDKIFVLDSECSEVKFDLQIDGWLDGFALAKDGQVVVGMSGVENAQVKVVDAEKKAFGDTYDLGISYFSSSGSLLSGNGDYDFYYYDDYGLYGYNMEEQEEAKLIDWVASDISSGQISSVIALADGSFFCTGYSTTDWSTYICRLVKVEPSEIQDKITLTLAGVYIDYEIMNQIIAFNKESDTYRIEVIDYGEETENIEEDPITKLNADIMAGNIPDILCVSTDMPLDEYAAKGLVEDLYPYLDADAELSREDFIPSILSSISSGDKLYQMAARFTVTTVIGRTSEVGETPGWTMDEMMAVIDSKGDDAIPFYWGSRETMLSNLCAENAKYFVNWETGECSFDSEEFIKILEFCNTFDSEEDMNWDEDTSLPSMIQDGTVLFEYSSISFDEIQLYSSMFGEDITFIGWPSEERRGAGVTPYGGLAMSAKSENKEGAWEFIRSFLTKDYQYYNCEWDLPTRQDVFDMLMKAHTATEEYTDEYGETIYPYESGWTWDEFEVEMGPLTEEEAKMMTDLIESADHMYYYDTNVMDIITEEAQVYFDGQKSAEEVAKIIQNRVQTYVNESR